MNTTPSTSDSSSSGTSDRRPGSGRRALVLAGGGAAGNAWELGVIAGLCEAGVYLTEADLIIGTSAGSTAAAQITSGIRPAELYAATTAVVPRPQTAGAGHDAGRIAGRTAVASSVNYLEWSNEIIASASDASDMRRRMGAAALEKDASDGATTSRWRDIVASRLTSHDWPAQAVLITAVDARSGQPVTFDRTSGVGLVDAVAASTSSLTPYRIGENRYLDGGYRRNENADLATGYSRVIVLSPFGGRSRMPQEWGMDLATQIAELRATGSEVETVFPDARAGDVFNAGAVDPSTRGQAAQGGHAQGLALAEKLGKFWR